MATQSKIGWRPYVNLATATYLLDTYGGAAAAYSLRKLKSDYTGPAIRVRRSSDNTSQDIGFNSNGNLDTNALLNFIGGYNQIQYSEEFDNAYWSKNGVTVTANQTTAPDGTMTGDMITESGNTNHSIRNSTSTSYPIGTNYNFSVYAKKESISSPDTFALSFADGNISNTYVLFNILNGTVVETYNYYNDSNFGSSIQDVGNGWFRCSVWGTATSSSNRQTMSIRFTNTSTVNFGYYSARATAKMYIWGYQMSKLSSNLQRYSKTTTLTAGHGFVSIWYDQISSFNKTQSTATRQPVIVSSGFINTMNSKPSLKFTTSSNSSFDLSGGPTINEPSTIFTTFKLDTSYSTTTQYQIFGGPTYDQQAKFSISNNKYYLSNISTYTKGISSTTTASSNPVITTALFSSIDKLRVNSDEVISGDVGGFSSHSIYIGRGYLGLYFLGDISELIIYTSDKTSDFNAIESNINTYYTIY
jgi:hypothetical protein